MSFRRFERVHIRATGYNMCESRMHAIDRSGVEENPGEKKNPANRAEPLALG